MPLHIYDSASRSLRPFEPVEPGKASIYLCGATVQAPPHLGHVRSGVNFDILRRWLERSGYQVSFVRNVTDIDDKILRKSAEAGVEWWAWAARYEREFAAAYDLLGCLPPTYEPRATGHVTEMVELMQRLIDAGHAYAVDGDVYFDVRSFPAYGVVCRGRSSTRCTRPRTPMTSSGGFAQARPARLRAVEAAQGRTSRPPPRGRHRGAADARAGTWSARRWRRSTSARPSTSTAAGWTWSSRTTRTRSRSRSAPATASPVTGCTTPG